MFFLDISDTACQHDRLVISSDFLSVMAFNLFFIGSEITDNIRSSEFIVETCRSKRSLNHNIKCGGNA